MSGDADLGILLALGGGGLDLNAGCLALAALQHGVDLDVVFGAVMEWLHPGLRPRRLAGEFHHDEALKQRPEGTADRITDLASAPSRLAAIPESTNAAFEYSVVVDG